MLIKSDCSQLIVVALAIVKRQLQAKLRNEKSYLLIEFELMDNSGFITRVFVHTTTSIGYIVKESIKPRVAEEYFVVANWLRTAVVRIIEIGATNEHN